MVALVVRISSLSPSSVWISLWRVAIASTAWSLVVSSTPTNWFHRTRCPKAFDTCDPPLSNFVVWSPWPRRGSDFRRHFDHLLRSIPLQCDSLTANTRSSSQCKGAFGVNVIRIELLGSVALPKGKSEPSSTSNPNSPNSACSSSPVASLGSRCRDGNPFISRPLSSGERKGGITSNGIDRKGGEERPKVRDATESL
jgi:hypothetical protein